MVGDLLLVVLNSCTVVTGTNPKRVTSIPRVLSILLVIADSVSKYITCAAGFVCKKFLTIDKAKNVLPVLDSPARAVILFDGRPPNILPLTKALKMKLPVSTKESQSPADIFKKTHNSIPFYYCTIKQRKIQAIHASQPAILLSLRHSLKEQ